MKIGIIAPMDPRTGISNYSETLVMELLKFGEDVSIISPENSKNQGLIKHPNFNHVDPQNYRVDDYGISHFQLANSPLHEFQLHIINKHKDELLNNSNVITTVHDARNFDVFNYKCSECLSYGLRNMDLKTYPYDVVDRGFQKISNILIFHNNSSLTEYRSRYHLKRESLKCIPHPAYRLAGDHPVQNIHDVPDKNVFIAPGYISPFKGQDILIKALNSIDTDLKLVFMGKNLDENYDVYLKKLVVTEGVEDKVKFLGFVSADKFIEEIDRATAVLIPRLNSEWLDNNTVFRIRKFLGLKYLITQSTSGVLTKALASGKPVICSDNQGFSDYVNSSRGILCDDKVESWRSAIEYIIDNPMEVEQMSINSRKFANEKLNPEHIANMHLNLYRQFSDNRNTIK
jgi:glycosyltransferase involved in cell wall biosynthesis